MQRRHAKLNLTGGFVGNRIDPSRLSSVALNFLKHVPVSTDPCGRLQYGIPNNNTEHQGLAKLDYTITSNSSLFARYFYAVYDNPATYDGSNVLTLSRTGQNNQVHSLVLGHNQVLSASTLNSLHITINRTLNDRPLPPFFSATDLGAKVSSLVPRYVGVTVTGNGFSVGSGATNPGYFNSKGFQIADDLDLVRGNHQFSIGGNWIHSRIETLNNRPTNGAFTFNGQGTGLSLADFMLGSVSGGFLQGNPVYDYDHSEYVGAYAQDNWRVRPNLTVNLGLRWEPFLPVKNTYSWVSHFDQTRFDQNVHSTVYPLAPAGLMFPGDSGYPGDATTFGKIAQFAPRVGVVWTPNGDERTSVRASWGVFYDTPHLFFNTRFANNPPWGAQITISNPPGGFADPYLGYPGGNPFPALNTGWATQPFPAFGVYVNTPLHLEPTSLQQWNVSVQRQIGDWLVAASYLGNHSSHLWRATELNPAVFGPGATTGNTNARRVLELANPVQGQFYGTIGQLDDTGRANYGAMLFSLQRRLKNNLSVLSNWTISKCMSDPATTEITGPTIVNPANPDADYAYCSSDRRHVVNVSVVARTPDFDNHVLRAILGDWQLSPIVRWQSGNRSTVTTGVDNALTGLGGQRAVQILDDPYGTGGPTAYLNRAAFTSPDDGHLQHARAVHHPEPEQPPERLRADADVQDRRGADGPVPVGSVQPDQPRQLQRAGGGVEQRELRPDSDGRRPAHHAVRAEVHVLMKKTFAAAALVSALVAALVAADVNDWPSHDHDAGGQRFSPLKQITPANVAKLQRAWTFDTGVTGLQVTPLVINGIMYVTAGKDIIALEPETAKVIWKYTAPAAVSRRGVAYWPGDRDTPPRLFSGAGDRLLAVDAERGKPAAGFGEGGSVDLKASIRGDVDGGFSLASPPSIYKNIIITGGNNGEQSPSSGLYGDIRGMGRAYRQAPVVVSHRAARRGAGRRDVGRRELEEPLRHQRLGVLHDRHRARHRLRADRGADVGLLRRRSQGREPVRQLRRGARRDDRQAEVAPAARAPRPVGLRRAGRADARRREAQRPARFRPWP